MKISTPQFTAAMIRLSPLPFVSYSLARIVTFFAPFGVLLIEQELFNAFGIAVQRTTVWWFVAAYAAVSLVRLGCLLIECWTNITFRYRAMGTLQLNTVASALDRPGAAASPVQPLEGLNRLRDDAGEVADFPLWLPEVVGTSIAASCAFFVMWQVDAPLSLLAMLPLLLQGMAALAFWRVYLHYRYAEGRLDDAYSVLIGTIVSKAQSIRLLALQTVFVAKVEALGTQRRRNALAKTAYEQLSTRNMVDVSVAISSALCLWYAVPEVAALRIGVGDLLVFFSGLSIVASLPQTWATFIGDYAQQRVSIERLSEPLPQRPAALITPRAWWHSPPHGRVQRVPFEPLAQLQVRSVSYLHADGRGITDVSLNITRGSFTVVTGQIGSGKSTLLDLCAGLLDPAAGDFVWNTQRSHSLRGAPVAAVAQLPFLLSASLRDNICFGSDGSALPVAITASMLTEDIAQMPAGLDTIVGPRGVRLSGGQRQRVALARALLVQSELLILDDVSSALDSATEAGILQNLRQHQSRTILASSTRPAIVAAADTIIVVADGRVVGTGTLTELLRTNTTMQELWSAIQRPEAPRAE